MDTLCYELLNGTLTYDGDNQAKFATRVINNFPMTILLDAVPNPGQPMPTLSGSYGSVGVAPGASFEIFNQGNVQNDYSPGYYRVSVAATGGLIGVIECSPSVATALVDFNLLNAPNDIGPIPAPTATLPVPVDPQPPTVRPGSTMIIPPDSARVVVGCGTAPTGNIVTREQYWARQNDSLCLAGHETRTVSYTVSSGMQQTSSDTSTVATSLGTSASAGWGPVSASISASLSKSTTSFQQVSVNQQTTSYISNQITNPHEEPIAYLRWQLTDVVTVLDQTTFAPLSSLIQAENPTVVLGPYWISPPQKPALDAAPARSGFFEYK